MADTFYTVLRNKIKEKLDGIAKLQEVHDEPGLEFQGYPAAVIFPSDQDSDYETTSDNERVYAFIISIFYEIADSGIGPALDALYDVVEDVMDAFDQDSRLSGIVMPDKYEMIGIRPVTGGWAEVSDKKLLQRDITLKVRVSVSVTP